LDDNLAWQHQLRRWIDRLFLNPIKGFDQLMGPCVVQIRRATANSGSFSEILEVFHFSNRRIRMLFSPLSPSRIFLRNLGKPPLKILPLDPHETIIIRIPQGACFSVIQYKYTPYKSNRKAQASTPSHQSGSCKQPLGLREVNIRLLLALSLSSCSQSRGVLA
jgi:hypothetical protein